MFCGALVGVAFGFVSRSPHCLPLFLGRVHPLDLGVFMDEFSRPLSWREWATVIATVVVAYPVLAGLLLVVGA